MFRRRFPRESSEDIKSGENCPSEEFLLDWLETPGNYAAWKSSSKESTGGKKNTTGKSKVAMSKEIEQQMKDAGIDYRNGQQILNKIANLETSHRVANDWLSATGKGITEEDEKMEVANIKTKVLSLCIHWYRLHPVFRDRPGNVPPYVGSSETVDDAAVLLFGNSGSGSDSDAQESSDSFQMELIREIRESASRTEKEETPTPAKDSRKMSESPNADCEKTPKRQKKNEKPMQLPEALVAIASQSSDIAEKRFQLTMKKMDMDIAMQKDTFELQKLKMEKDEIARKEEIELRREELKLRVLEAENQRLQLKLQLKENF